MMKLKWLFSIMIVLSLFVLAGCGVKSSTGATKTTQSASNAGQVAPMFDLKDLNGNKVELASLAGEKVYVKYWASWCSICLGGLEELNELAGQDNGFKVITIVSPNYKGEQSSKEFTEWFKGLEDKQKNNLTVLLDEDGKWAQKFGVRGYPSSYYIGSDGILAKSVPGHNFNDAIITNFKKIS